MPTIVKPATVIGSIHQDSVDHLIVVDERHLRKILRSYLAYYHDSRTHLGRAGDSPKPREVARAECGSIVALPLLAAAPSLDTPRCLELIPKYSGQRQEFTSEDKPVLWGPISPMDRPLPRKTEH